MRSGRYRGSRSTRGFGRCRLARSRDSGWGCRCCCSFIWSGSPSDLLSLHGSRGIIPWELTDLLRDPWVPGLPTLARALLPLGISAHTAITLLLSCYAGSLLALALGFHTRLSAFLAWGLHLSLVTSGFCVCLWRGSAGQYVPLLSLALSVRARLDVRVSSGLPRREETIPVGCLRVMQVHLCVIYLAAGLDQGHGETVVERRGHLAGGLSARLSAPSISAGWRASLDPDARWLGHVGGGDRLRVSHLATPHPEGVVPSRRSDCTWASACSWGSSSFRA